MDLRLDGKRALVTGSTAGIGYAIAEGLAQEGAEVIVNGRSAERVVEAVGAINHTTSTRAIGIAADLGSADGVTRLVKEVGRVDILVNNVGVFAPVPFTDISDEAWQEIFDINVMSGVRLSRALVHGMVERKWGRIIFISSESGVQIPAEMVHYGVTKTAQLALSRGIAESVAGTGVTVNAVLPGPTRSEGVEEFVGKLADNQGADLETSSATSSRPCVPPPSLAGSPKRKKWRTWSCFSVEKDPPLLPAPRSESTEAWCVALSDRLSLRKLEHKRAGT